MFNQLYYVHLQKKKKKHSEKHVKIRHDLRHCAIYPSKPLFHLCQVKYGVWSTHTLKGKNVHTYGSNRTQNDQYEIKQSWLVTCFMTWSNRNMQTSVNIVIFLLIKDASN